MRYLLIAILLNSVAFAQEDEIDTLSITDLSRDREQKLLFEGELFTGVVIEESKYMRSFSHYSDGIRNGDFVEYWLENGYVRAKGNYVRGLENGLFTYYNVKGDTIQNGAFDYGEEEGAWYNYYEQSGIEWFRNFSQGIKEGYWLKIKIDGDTIASGNFFNGFETGKWRIYDHELKKLVTKIYLTPKEKTKELPDRVGEKDLTERNGIYYYENVPYSGQTVIRHKNDQIKKKVVYKKGRIKTQEDYFEDGQAFLKSSYKKGLMHGKWIYYNPDGTVLQTEPYKKGTLEGEVWRYNDKGYQLTTTTYANGMRNGPRIEWSNVKEGIPKKEYSYKNDTLHGVQKRFSNEGVLVETKTYVMGKKTGPAKFWDKDGNLISEAEYWDDYHTAVKTYYESGKVKTEMVQIKDHKKSYIEYYESSDLKKRGLIKHDKKHEEWDYYLRGGGKVILRTDYNLNEIEHVEMLNTEEFTFYDYQYEGESELEALINQIREELKSEDLAALWSHFADRIYIDEKDVEHDLPKDKAEVWENYLQNPKFKQHVLAYFNEASKTGIYKANQEELKLNATIDAKPLFLNHKFANKDLQAYYEEEDVALPVDGGLLNVYAEPIPGSQPIGQIAAYPGKIYNGCTNDKDSYDGCWYKVHHHGEIAYINDIEEYHHYTQLNFMFQKIKGEWKIIGFF